MKSYHRSEILWGYALILPTFVGVGVLNLYPMLRTLWLSFNRSLGFGRMEYSGAENYIRFFTDDILGRITGNTFLFVLYTVPAALLASLVVASFLNARIKGKGLYRVIYFIPVVTAATVVGMVWRWILNGEFGVLNYLLGLVGIGEVPWLTQAPFAMISISIVSIWNTLGYNMIIFLAGLQTISPTYYEAARIDGAGPVRQFFSVTLPLVSPTTFFLATTSIMAGLKQFDLVYTMSSATSTTTITPAIGSIETLIYTYYRHAFIAREYGYASVIVLYTFVITMIVTLLQFLYQKKWVHYES